MEQVEKGVTDETKDEMDPWSGWGKGEGKKLREAI